MPAPFAPWRDRLVPQRSPCGHARSSALDEAMTPPFTIDHRTAAEYLKALPGWERRSNEIVKLFTFKNYYETIAFVNATACVGWIL